MTTNAGSEFDSASIGFNSDNAVTLKNNVEKSLKERFRPEFLNRIDETVTFSPLTKDELGKIVDLMLSDITGRMAQKGASINITDSAKALILEKGFDIKYGARPLKRAIQTLIEDKLADFSLKNTISEGMQIIADAKGEEIEITALSKI